MSDFTWIALIIIVYIIVIKPLIQGFAQKQNHKTSHKKSEIQTNKNNSEPEYTDYEEVK